MKITLERYLVVNLTKYCVTTLPKMMSRYFYKYTDFSFIKRKKIAVLLDLAGSFCKGKQSLSYFHLKFGYRVFVFYINHF